MKLKKIATVALVGSLSCLALTGCGDKTINLNKCTEVEISGYNGYGTATVTVDNEALDEAMKNVKYENASEYSYLFGSASDYLQDFCMSYSLDKRSGLSNGDEVTLTWNIDDALVESATNAKFKYEDITVKVKGLSEAPTFDAFAGVDVTFSGTSPDGNASVKGGVEGISYKLDKSSDLKNGDIVTVSVQNIGNVESFLKEYGALPAETEMQFTVEGLTAYAQSFEEISEEMHTKMDTQSRRLIAASQGSFEDPSTGFPDEAEFVGTYFKTRLGESYWSDDEENIAGLVYKLYAKDMVTGEKFSYYWYVEFPNVMVLPDGTTSVDIANADYPNYESSWFSTTGTYFIRSDYGYAGYDNLDSLIYNRLTADAAEFNYDSNIAE